MLHKHSGATKLIVVLLVLVCVIAIGSATVRGWRAPLAQWASIVQGIAVVMAAIIAVVGYFATGRADTSQLHAACREVRRHYQTYAQDRSIPEEELISAYWRELNTEPTPLQPVSALPCWIATHARGGAAVVGAAGAGKTTSAILTLGTMSHAEGLPSDPTKLPLLLNVSSWDPKRHLFTWASSQLEREVSVLRSTEKYGRHVAEDIVAGALLLLDGFDELAPEAQVAALKSLAGTRHSGYVVFSRTQAYENAATRARRKLPVAQLVELSVKDSADYLRQSPAAADTSVSGLIAELDEGSDCKAARVLRTPLFLVLARRQLTATRSAATLGRLLHSPEGEAEDLLLEGVLEQAFPPGPLDPRDQAHFRIEQARRWLRTTAKAMRNSSQPSQFVWWALPSVVPWFVQVSLAAAVALALGLLPRVSTADAAWICFLTATAVAAATARRTSSGFVSSLAGPLRAATVVALGGVALSIASSKDGASAGLWHRAAGSLPAGLASGVVAFLLFAEVQYIWTKMQWYPRLGVPRLYGWNWHRRKASLSAIPGIMFGFGVAALPRRPEEHVTAQSAPAIHVTPITFVQGVAVGLVTGALFSAALMFGVRPQPLSSEKLMSQVRGNLLFGLVATFLWWAAVLFPALSLALALVPRADAPAVQSVAASMWAFVYLGCLLAPIGLLVTAGGRFVVASTILALAGRWPRRPFQFLDKAQDRGILRRNGWSYEFNPSRLRDHLAQT